MGGRSAAPPRGACGTLRLLQLPSAHIRWHRVTPAVEAGVADHVWTINCCNENSPSRARDQLNGCVVVLRAEASSFMQAGLQACSVLKGRALHIR